LRTPSRTSQRVSVEPPLNLVEAAFVASFQDSAVRRVWPGQPSSRSPWAPTSDGRELVLDERPDAEAAATTAGWLRFLAREFLAPRTESSLVLARRNGLDGGHRLTGRVLLDGVREITVSNNRVNERVLQRGPDADVFELDDRRRAHNTDR
jgi:hypothetical protein